VPENPMNNSLAIRPLTPDDADALSTLLRSQTPGYARFFRPFDFDRDTITSVLASHNQDVMMGLYWQDELVGFFMLRGWNEGYDVPAFGILIDEKYRGCGLEMISLETAKIICKLRGSSRLMIKMHPDNISAKGVLRKTGFIRSGVESESGNLIYHFDISPRRKQS
jgi:RimJ/RimL family protein N-acetyltransferase